MDCFLRIPTLFRRLKKKALHCRCRNKSSDKLNNKTLFDTDENLNKSYVIIHTISKKKRNRIHACKFNDPKQCNSICPKSKLIRCKIVDPSYIHLGIREIKILRDLKYTITPVDKLQRYLHHQIKNSKCEIFTEYIQGTDLFFHMKLQPIGSSHIRNEHHILDYFKEMLVCVKQCHDAGIAHLDIKLENFIVVNNNPPELKLIDFEMARNIKHPHKTTQLSQALGTKIYNSPEVSNLRYHANSDVWSLGVNLWAMITGNIPFLELKEGTDVFFPNKFHLTYKPLMTQNLWDLFTHIFVVDPIQRIPLSDIFTHPFVKKIRRMSI